MEDILWKELLKQDFKDQQKASYWLAIKTGPQGQTQKGDGYVSTNTPLGCATEALTIGYTKVINMLSELARIPIVYRMQNLIAGEAKKPKTFYCGYCPGNIDGC